MNKAHKEVPDTPDGFLAGKSGLGLAEAAYEELATWIRSWASNETAKRILVNRVNVDEIVRAYVNALSGIPDQDVLLAIVRNTQYLTSQGSFQPSVAHITTAKIELPVVVQESVQYSRPYSKQSAITRRSRATAGPRQMVTLIK